VLVWFVHHDERVPQQRLNDLGDSQLAGVVEWGPSCRVRHPIRFKVWFLQEAEDQGHNVPLNRNIQLLLFR